MRLGLLMAIMHVMGRLGLFGPYLRFIDSLLEALDQSCEEEFGAPWQDELEDMEGGV